MFSEFIYKVMHVYNVHLTLLVIENYDRSIGENAHDYQFLLFSKHVLFCCKISIFVNIFHFIHDTISMQPLKYIIEQLV